LPAGQTGESWRGSRRGSDCGWGDKNAFLGYNSKEEELEVLLFLISFISAIIELISKEWRERVEYVPSGASAPAPW
jgi:hypothetical protein